MAKSHQSQRIRKGKERKGEEETDEKYKKRRLTVLGSISDKSLAN
jgi:hypothetical protein